MLLELNEIKEKVAKVAKKYNLNKVFLCGSYAKGYATENSDLDFCIDPGKTIGLFECGGILNDLKESLNKDVDIVLEGSRKEFLDKFKMGSKIIYG